VTVPLFQVDAFTAEPFAGNPAAVCLLEQEADPGWMQRVAAEMNLAETAFVRPDGPGGDVFGLRWFTPAVEVALCGHATLASAHVLWSEGRVPAGRSIRFQTLSGELRADDRDDAIELDFPATPPAPAEPPPGCWRRSASRRGRSAGPGGAASTTCWSSAPRRPCAAWTRTSGGCGRSPPGA
jgi:PhzF family phenazine biosynthesis protein